MTSLKFVKLIEILVFSAVFNLSSLSLSSVLFLWSLMLLLFFIYAHCIYSLYTDLIIWLFVLLSVYITRSELGLEPGSEASSTFHVGQVVKCRVINAVPASRRINLSFVISPKRFTLFMYIATLIIEL